MTERNNIIPAPSHQTQLGELRQNRSGASTDKQFIELWLSDLGNENTQRSYAKVTEGFVDFMRIRGIKLRTCTLLDLKDWARGLSGKRSTVQHHAAVIKSLFTLAMKTGYVEFNVAATLKVRKLDDDLAQRIMTEEEVARVVEHATPRARPIIELLYYTGARVVEACGLQWLHVRRVAVEEEIGHLEGDVRIKYAAIVTLHGKGGKIRNVRLEPAQADVLWRLADESTLATLLGSDAYVFATRTGKAPHPSEVNNMVKRAVVAAGYAEWADKKKKRGKIIGKGISPHWFRHAHASHALDGGAPVQLVRETLGHASLSTTTRYAHAKPGQSSSSYVKPVGEEKKG